MLARAVFKETCMLVPHASGANLFEIETCLKQTNVERRKNVIPSSVRLCFREWMLHFKQCSDRKFMHTNQFDIRLETLQCVGQLN